MHRRWVFVLWAVAAVASAAVSVLFLIGEGLERASWWAGIGSLTVAVTAVVVSVIRWRTNRSAPASGDQQATQPGPAGREEGRPAIRQDNSGGINIANTGRIGDIDIGAEPK
ncbi:hypothetical protein [Micromonospora sp. NPDC048839]|uniref:hypothetical protein n=1 Tax=Micromonospora sp. NPDC048839 TaxID=3155641 RepID=UPI0033F91A16